jgi:uncharacterized phage-associated protein
MPTNAREKLIEAIVYFAHNTLHCGKLKLFKLLYLLDFEHYRETGRSVTGLDYEAWQKGPVPKSLYAEWLDPNDDLAQAVVVKPEKVYDKTRETVKDLRAPDESVFTKREMRLLTQIAKEHRDALTSDMINATHKDGSPWHSTWRGGEGKNERIAYDLALVGCPPELVAAIKEHREYVELTG